MTLISVSLISLRITMVGQQFTGAERSFMVKVYYETRSPTEVQRQFGIHFPNRPVPTKPTILNNVKKYENHGTSLNRNKGNSGRPRTVRTPQNIQTVQNELTRNPNSSARRNNLPNLSNLCKLW